MWKKSSPQREPDESRSLYPAMVRGMLPVILEESPRQRKLLCIHVCMSYVCMYVRMYVCSYTLAINFVKRFHEHGLPACVYLLIIHTFVQKYGKCLIMCDTVFLPPKLRLRNELLKMMSGSTCTGRLTAPLHSTLMEPSGNLTTTDILFLVLREIQIWGRGGGWSYNSNTLVDVVHREHTVRTY